MLSFDGSRTCCTPRITQRTDAFVQLSRKTSDFFSGIMPENRQMLPVAQRMIVCVLNRELMASSFEGQHAGMLYDRPDQIRNTLQSNATTSRNSENLRSRTNQVTFWFNSRNSMRPDSRQRLFTSSQLTISLHSGSAWISGQLPGSPSR